MTLIWWKFKRHRVALLSLVFLGLVYGSLPFVEVLAPYSLTQRHGDFLYAPPQPVHLFHDGSFAGPIVYPYRFTFDLERFQRNYVVDRDKPQALRFLCRGEPYRLWGVIAADFHIVCPPENGTFFLFGTDRLGRDLFSRIIYGARISMTVGLIGILVSFVIGLTLGGLAGYVGGWIDHVVSAQHRDPALLAGAAALACLVGGAARELEPDPGLLRHHPDSRPARLARPGARGPLQASVAQGGGICPRRRADGRFARQDHRPPPHPQLHEPPDRQRHPVHSGDDPRRDRAVLPRPWPPTAGDELGRAAQRGAEPRLDRRSIPG